MNQNAPRLSCRRYTDKETKTSYHFSSGWLRDSVFIVVGGSFELHAYSGVRARASVWISGAAAVEARAPGGCGHRGHSQHGGARFEAGGSLGQRRAAGGGEAIGSPSLVRSLGQFDHRARVDGVAKVIALGCRPVAIAPLGG